MLYEHDFDKVDRLDSYLSTVDPVSLQNYSVEGCAYKKWNPKVIGLYSYMFSNLMSFNINPEEFEIKKSVVLENAESFMMTLKPDTVYKVLFVGITGDGEIRSSSEGSFFISRSTRPLYITMKLKKTIRSFAFRYKGVDFDCWTLSYKEWLKVDDINNGIEKVQDTINKMHDRELIKDTMAKDENYSFNIGHNIDSYKTWLSEVGSIGRCESLSSKGKYLVKQTFVKESSYKVIVENVVSCETISWVDKWVNKGQGLWIRCFNDGISLYYSGESYMRYELAFKTEFWAPEAKSYEYNNKFGAADIETYSVQGKEGDGLQMPYAAEFKDSKGQCKQFYVQKGDSEYAVVIRMMEEMLSLRYSGCTFYIHNLARFDSRFILEALGRMEDVGVRLWGRDMHNIFKIRASKKIGKKYINVVFLDSFYQLPFKLDTLGRKFNTKVQKTLFPYRFVNASNLFYQGAMPPIEFFDGKLNILTYNDLSKKLWDLKDETLKYLHNDVECLFQVMHKYNRTVFDDFLVNAVKISSYSGLSKKVYITNFYPNVKLKIPVISGYLEEWIRRGYKGGIVDVVQHLVSDAVKYDSNSHYPAAMLNAMPVGIPRFTDNKNLSEIFGFCYAEVTAPTEQELTCPILPTKDENGDLHCPRGVWRDTYFSEELKNAVAYGYKVEILGALIFDKGYGLFEEFIKEMFKRKANAKEMGDAIEELLYKLIQNSLYGKSGQKEIIDSFKFIDNKDVKNFELKNKTDLIHEFGNKTLIRTQGKLDSDLEGVITNENIVEDLASPRRKKGNVKSSVSIAAAITAYARVAMSQYKNIAGNKYLGGDTDSAIMEKRVKSSSYR